MKFIDMIKNSNRINNNHYKARVLNGKNEEETTAVIRAEKPL